MQTSQACFTTKGSNHCSAFPMSTNTHPGSEKEGGYGGWSVTVYSPGLIVRKCCIGTEVFKIFKSCVPGLRKCTQSSQVYVLCHSW